MKLDFEILFICIFNFFPFSLKRSCEIKSIDYILNIKINIRINKIESTIFSTSEEKGFLTFRIDLSKFSFLFWLQQFARSIYFMAPIAKEETARVLWPLLRQSYKNFLRVANWRSGVVDLERRLIPQKDILRMNDVNWLNTFPWEHAPSEQDLFA